MKHPSYDGNSVTVLGCFQCAEMIKREATSAAPNIVGVSKEHNESFTCGKLENLVRQLIRGGIIAISFVGQATNECTDAFSLAVAKCRRCEQQRCFIMSANAIVMNVIVVHLSLSLFLSQDIVPGKVFCDISRRCNQKRKISSYQQPHTRLCCGCVIVLLLITPNEFCRFASVRSSTTVHAHRVQDID
jgi:hypothetical protein